MTHVIGRELHCSGRRDPGHEGGQALVVATEAMCPADLAECTSQGGLHVLVKHILGRTVLDAAASDRDAAPSGVEPGGVERQGDNHKLWQVM